jgi:hypothetical protein
MSFAKTFEIQLAETRERVAAIDALCARIARNVLPALKAARLRGSSARIPDLMDRKWFR